MGNDMVRGFCDFWSLGRSFRGNDDMNVLVVVCMVWWYLDKSFAANFVENLTVKKFRKSVEN